MAGRFRRARGGFRAADYLREFIVLFSSALRALICRSRTRSNRRPWLPSQMQATQMQYWCFAKVCSNLLTKDGEMARLDFALRKFVNLQSATIKDGIGNFPSIGKASEAQKQLLFLLQAENIQGFIGYPWDDGCRPTIPEREAPAQRLTLGSLTANLAGELRCAPRRRATSVSKQQRSKSSYAAVAMTRAPTQRACRPYAPPVSFFKDNTKLRDLIVPDQSNFFKFLILTEGAEMLVSDFVEKYGVSPEEAVALHW